MSTFIRVNQCALVRPKIIQQYLETKRKSRPPAEGTLQKETQLTTLLAFIESGWHHYPVGS